MGILWGFLGGNSPLGAGNFKIPNFQLNSIFRKNVKNVNNCLKMYKIAKYSPILAAYKSNLLEIAFFSGIRP